MSQPNKRRGRIPGAKQKPKRKKASGRGSTALNALVLLGLAVVAGAGLLWLWPRCSGEGCPSVEALRDYTPPQASRVLDGRGQVVAHLAPERRIVVPLERIPSLVSSAFLAVEDRRFYQHEGVDYRRVVGALIRDARSLSFEEGFSTITMQLARNVFPTHLTREKTLRRKLWEVVLARDIERAFSKDQILEMYLNQIYLGEGLYGVEAASQGYFGKSVGQLAPAEAAMLAALPKAPNSYGPRRNPVAAVERRNLVLGLMAGAGVIGAGEEDELRATPLGLVPPAESRGVAPYFIAAVREELRERFGPDAETAGLRVHTALDPALQRNAAAALRDQLAAIERDELGNFRGPSCTTDESVEASACLQGLFVALDARTGDILAMVGGRDFARSQFNRVTQARRQSGSAFKPFVFASALEIGIPITTPLLGPGAPDYEGGYLPADHVSAAEGLDLRDALRLSSNRAAVVLGERVGVANVIRTAHSLGISTPMKEYPSTFLGAADVIPLELVGAYTAFANEGVAATPRLIRRVETANGELLWEASVQRRQVLSREVAFLTNSLMQDVVNRGTGYRVRTAGLPASIPAAGKTGTTDNSADTWFVGVTSEVAAGVWFGFDRPARIMAGADGGRLAAPVWGRVMASYYEKRPPPAPWAPPLDLVMVTVDHQTGLLPTSACPDEHVVEEWFLRGTEPLEHCHLHPEPGVEGWFRRRIRDVGDWLGGGPRERTRAEPAPAN